MREESQREDPTERWWLLVDARVEAQRQMAIRGCEIGATDSGGAAVSEGFGAERGGGEIGRRERGVEASGRERKWLGLR
ncbi:hypothetical protein AMTR_s00183p00016820 [Amborella trichopoda]|uniref:Uncharacterized protein n=1 Tax=Amborella trichopoda TaxID=13333 RepID=U5CTT9_AMBTC|nr:hypothetical protein AMTR_s00183p00016820 [Amborella trichopoda]